MKENGFYVVDEYVDDGWSGTNFERPAFQRMIADIESGNCVITKGLSRFGRKHVMMDYYLEFYFVDKKVRNSLTAKFRAGEKLCAYAPIGY